MSDVSAKTIIVDYQEWMDLHHKIDILIDCLVDMNALPCGMMEAVYDQGGESWCEFHCSDRDLTATDCWHKFLEEG